MSRPFGWACFYFVVDFFYFYLFQHSTVFTLPKSVTYVTLLGMPAMRLEARNRLRRRGATGLPDFGQNCFSFGEALFQNREAIHVGVGKKKGILWDALNL
jgi:hypothetical protein